MKEIVCDRCRKPIYGNKYSEMEIRKKDHDDGSVGIGATYTADFCPNCSAAMDSTLNKIIHMRLKVE